MSVLQLQRFHIGEKIIELVRTNRTGAITGIHEPEDDADDPEWEYEIAWETDANEFPIVVKQSEIAIIVF